MTDAPAARSKHQAVRSVGRPRRLTLDQVLDAALELGLDNLTMAAVASRLGVGVAVLYSYVKNREELVRFASIRAAHQHGFPEDKGQHWAHYVSDYARGLYEMLTSNSQLIASFLEGGLGPEAQIDSAEAWMSALTGRGFTPQESVQLLRVVGQLVLGCAATAIHARALAANGTSYSAAACKAINSRSDEELPLLKRHIDMFTDDIQYGSWKGGLQLILEAVAAEREEALPLSSSVKR